MTAAPPRLPNLLSLACLALGFGAITAVSAHDWDAALRLLLLAAAADAWAGRRAIRRGQQSAMGLELDSLSGLLSFGVAPMALVYAQVLRPWQPWGWILAGGLAVLCSFRLARDTADRPEVDHYRGLPVPVFGFAAALAAGLSTSPAGLAAFLLWLGLLMLLRLPYQRLGASGLALVVAPLAAAAALGSDYINLRIAALGVVVLYALGGHTRWFGKLVRSPQWDAGTE